ncbi:MAG: hypothetical protein AAF702_41585 [Chloroflexota bacterium]
MQIILSDHNCEGQAEAIFNTLHYDGIWLDLVPMELRWFTDIELEEKPQMNVSGERVKKRITSSSLVTDQAQMVNFPSNT